MASRVESLYPSLVKNKFWQSDRTKNEELLCECGKQTPSGSTKSVELDGLQSDLSELIHILHVARRPTVKEVIQADIQLTLAKIESLGALLESQPESNISWTKVAALKNNKSKYVKQKVSDPFQLTPNRFNPLGNDVKDDDGNEDTPTKADSLSESATHRVMKFKKDHKKQNVVNKIHKVVIVGDSHARGCASEVKQKLNSE